MFNKRNFIFKNLTFNHTWFISQNEVNICWSQYWSCWICFKNKDYLSNYCICLIIRFKVTYHCISFWISLFKLVKYFIFLIILIRIIFRLTNIIFRTIVLKWTLSYNYRSSYMKPFLKNYLKIFNIDLL